MDPSELDRQQLEDLLAGLHDASFGWALSCCDWNDADAEDVLQATYVKVLSGSARFGGRSTFRTWLFGVIRRTALEQKRQARSHRERAERLGREVAGAVSADVADADAERADRARALVAALAELPPRQREVLHLVFYQDLTIREAAEVMHVSIGSARVHYERGKKRLRDLLAEEEPVPGGGA
ncbi:MAG TPA: RNA polymerase sigma factor [Longimicrobiales bacterium]|nr:RNA polymerase sigma factor [Longimicrobiales bacterium]